MVEPTASWATAGRDLLNLAIRRTPQRFLRWRWPVAKLLDAITIFADAQPAIFQIGAERPSHDLECITFHVFNFSPLELALVGAEIEVQLHSMTLLTSRERFPAQLPLLPFSRGGFPFRKTLSGQQSQTLQRETDDLNTAS